MKRVVIVGGGIVGLATAYKLLEQSPGLSVTVLEKEATVASHQTGHNSGVIHSGLYYKPGSEKARLSVAGRRELIEFCGRHDVAHEICGKLVVAHDDRERAALDTLLERGSGNGLSGLRILSAAEAREREPHVACVAALLVPETGIVDFKEVARALVEEIERRGGSVQTSSRVGRVTRRNGWHIETSRGDHAADFFIACAGLQADRVAAMTAPNGHVRVVPFRGHYFGIKPERSSLVRHLIYPVPDPLFPFLGVHATRTIDGHIHVGPTATLALSRESYRPHSLNARDTASALTFPGLWRFVRRHPAAVRDGLHLAVSKHAFLRAVQRLIPEIRADDLTDATLGIRAQAMLPDGRLVDDFSFVEEASAIHVLNAPSPAATSCLSIGSFIAGRATAALNT